MNSSDNPSATQVCVGPCGEKKSLEEFHRNRSYKSGRLPRCKVCQREFVRRYRHEVRPGFIKRQNLKKYGLTLEQFEEMVSEQEGCCAICRRVMKEPVVDHCHDTRVVRGLLCHSCNRGIGLLGDNPEVLKRATVYLEKS